MVNQGGNDVGSSDEKIPKYQSESNEEEVEPNIFLFYPRFLTETFYIRQ